MSRYSPTVLPDAGAQGPSLADRIGNAMQVIQGDRLRRKQEAEHAEDRDYLRTQRVNAESDRETQALVRNLELRKHGIVTGDQAERVSRPDRFGNVVRDLKGNEARPIDSARYSRVGAAGGQTYFEDRTRTPEGREETQRERLRQALQAGNMAEVATLTGDLRAMDPKEWKPTTREEAEGHFANTTLKNTQQNNSAAVALENLREKNIRKRGETGGNWQMLQTDGGFVQVDPRSGQTRPITDASGNPVMPKTGTPQDPAFRERRGNIGKALFPTGTMTEFQQTLVDQLAAGKPKAQVLAEMKAAGVPAAMIQQAERSMPDHRLGRMGLK